MITFLTINLATFSVITLTHVHKIVIHVSKGIALYLLTVFHIEHELQIHQRSHILIFLLTLKQLLLQ